VCSSDLDVQARGPVHEAFAEPTGEAPAPGPVVPKEPPAPIEEAPPDEKPEGDHVVFIPGYWAWDAEASDYLWVSGFWRAAPPGRTWAPGHWQEVDGGWQWAPGYWAAEEAQEEVEYLPPPPQTLDRGPVVPAPAENYDYVPGVWLHQTTRWLWRPGHWGGDRPGWGWGNPVYPWSPAGCIFVQGFWDLPLLDRGLLCAPVRFTREVYTRRDFVYRPVYIVQPDFLAGALFVSRTTHHYHFGDYFDVRVRKDFVPWNEYRVHRTVIDPNFAYYRTAYVRHPSWERGLATLYKGRYEGEVPRPPRTLVQQTKIVNNITVNKTTNVVVNKTVNITNVQNVTVLAPIRQVNKVQVTALASLANLNPKEAPPAVLRQVKVVQVTKVQQQEARQHVQRVRALQQGRKAAEAKVVARGAAPTKTAAPVKVKVELPKGTPPARVVKTTLKPPPPPDQPKADPKTSHPVTAGKQPPHKEGKQPPKDGKQPPHKEKEVRPPTKEKEKPKPPKEKDLKPPHKEVILPPKDVKPPMKEVKLPPKKEEVKPPPKKEEVKPPPKKEEVKPPHKEKQPPPPPPKEKQPPPPPHKDKQPPPPPPKEKQPPPPPPKDKQPPPPPPKEKPKEKPKDKPPTALRDEGRGLLVARLDDPYPARRR